MENMRFCAFIGGVLVAATLIGCNGSSSGDGSSSSGDLPNSAAGPLPALGDYMPPLDEGRLEIAPPDGWIIPPRSSKWLVRFQGDPVAPYPSIIVTATDNAEFKTVGKSNVAKFVAAVARRLESEGRSTTVETIRLDDVYGATYHRRARVKNGMDDILERVFVETVVDGRQYTVELRTHAGRLDMDRLCLYAVVAGLKFPLAVGSFDTLEAGTGDEPEAKEPADDAQGEEPAPNGAEAAPAEDSEPAPQEPEAPEPAEDPEPPAEEPEPPAEEPEAEAEPEQPAAEEPTAEEPAEADQPEEEPPAEEKSGEEQLLEDIEGLLD